MFELLPVALGKVYMSNDEKDQVDQLQPAECPIATVLKDLVAIFFGLQAQLPYHLLVQQNEAKAFGAVGTHR